MKLLISEITPFIDTTTLFEKLIKKDYVNGIPVRVNIPVKIGIQLQINLEQVDVVSPKDIDDSFFLIPQ